MAEIHAQARTPPVLRSRPWWGHSHGSPNEKVSKRISQRSSYVSELVEVIGKPPCRSCWTFTMWNLLEICLLELAVNLPSRIRGKVVHDEGSPCRHSTTKLPRGELLGVKLLGAGCYQLACTAGIRSRVLGKLSGQQSLDTSHMLFRSLLSGYVGTRK